MPDSVPNRDSRTMQPLPWKLEHFDGTATDMLAHNGKAIASFWGGDERHPKNLQWPTRDQMLRHAKYAAHACNAFPKLIQALETLYEDSRTIPEVKTFIEAVMKENYTEEVPPYAGK